MKITLVYNFITHICLVFNFISIVISLRNPARFSSNSVRTSFFKRIVSVSGLQCEIDNGEPGSRLKRLLKRKFRTTSFQAKDGISPDGNTEGDMEFVDESKLREVWERSIYKHDQFDEKKAMMIMIQDEMDDEEDMEYVSRQVSGISLGRRQTVDKTINTTSFLNAKGLPQKNMQSKNDQILPNPTKSLNSRSLGRSVGIDLGTTNSVVAVLEAGVPLAIPILNTAPTKPSLFPAVSASGRGPRSSILPSVVAYEANGTALVGEAARRQQVKSSGESLSVLRVDRNPAHKDVTDGVDLCRLSSPVFRETSVAGITNGIFGSRGVKPEEVSADILRALIKTAETYLGEPVKRAVVTVPAYFLPAQCAATKRAALLAGLEKVKLLREPESAALAYGLRERSAQLVLVVDLGGGTLDVSVLEVGDGFVEVLATSGDAHLGGDDFDAVVVSWIETQFLLQLEGEISDSLKSSDAVADLPTIQMLRSDPFMIRRLRETAENARIALSSQQSVQVSLPMLAGGYSFSGILTRGKLESMCKPLLARMLRPLREACLMARVNLPGESGQAGLVTELFDGSDVHQGGTDLDVHELRRKQSGGRAEARRRQQLKGSTTKEVRRLQKVTGDSAMSAFPTGVELNTVLLVGGATRMPMVRRLVRTMTGKEPLSNASVDPDLAVALGAAVLAGMTDGDEEVGNMQVLSAWQAALYRAFYEEQLKREEKNETVDEISENTSSELDNVNNYSDKQRKENGEMKSSPNHKRKLLQLRHRK